MTNASLYTKFRVFRKDYIMPGMPPPIPAAAPKSGPDSSGGHH
ncbi:MAG: hypothetical protein AAFY70_08635 [Bacteroidota bacterium]